ncbi:MAG: hypothetical protein ACI4J1_10730 [Ruminiclostridium sp.]
MEKDLSSLALYTGLSYNEKTDTLSGTERGYNIAVKEGADNGSYSIYCWVKSSELSLPENLDSFMNEYKNGTPNGIIGWRYADNTMLAVMGKSGDSEQNGKALKAFAEDLTMFFSMNGYESCCAFCGGEDGMGIYDDGTAVFQLCTKCMHEKKSGQPAFAGAASTQNAAVQQAQDFAAQTPLSYGQPAQNVSAQTPPPYGQPAQNVSAQTPPPYGQPAQNVSVQTPPPYGQPASNNGAQTPPPYGQTPPPQPFPQQNGFGNVSPDLVFEPVKPVKNNVALGFLGAVLFSIIGALIWLLISQLGYISYLGGLAVSFFTVFGYKKFSGGGFNAVSIFVCIIVIAGMVFLAELSSMTLFIMQSINDSYGTGISFFETLEWIPVFLSDSEISGSLTHDLIFGYIVTAISAVAIFSIEIKKAK